MIVAAYTVTPHPTQEQTGEEEKGMVKVVDWHRSGENP
jgi:hypothetical protein